MAPLLSCSLALLLSCSLALLLSCSLALLLHEVYEAPDGTQYTDKAEAMAMIRNQSGPAIAALVALSDKFVICKKILEEQTSKTEEQNIEDIDMHMDCLNDPEILRKNMAKGQTSKWLNHLDDVLIMGHYHHDAVALLAVLQQEEAVDIASQGVFHDAVCLLFFSSSFCSFSKLSNCPFIFFLG
jgi:hypothetical protein